MLAAERAFWHMFWAVRAAGRQRGREFQRGIR